MDAVTCSLRRLTVPVNSAAHWEDLYLEDGGDHPGEAGGVVDLTSTSSLDVRPTVPTTA